MLMIAIMVILVFGILTAGMARLLSASGDQVGYEMLGTRALASANSGLEWGLYELTRQGVSCATLISTAPTGSLDSSGLPHCQLTLECTLLSLSAGNSTLLKATGVCDNGELTVQRKVEALVK
jgi:hypothetical protein